MKRPACIGRADAGEGSCRSAALRRNAGDAGMPAMQATHFCMAAFSDV